MKNECLPEMQPIKVTPNVYTSRVSLIDNCSYRIGKIVFISMRFVVVSNSVGVGQELFTNLPPVRGSAQSSLSRALVFASNSKAIGMTVNGTIIPIEENLNIDQNINISMAYVTD